MRYEKSPDADRLVGELVAALELHHIDLSRLVCVRSYGSRSRRTLARCHALPKILQTAMGLRAHYVIELVTEHYDRLPPAEQIKTLIHELLHIPVGFANGGGGGFRQHHLVTHRAVDRLYRHWVKTRETAG
ncbi:MAG: putative metallopeptidase [Nitrospirota bacterium]